jgi:D-sedoheptulose 7-phosphate isomerase
MIEDHLRLSIAALEKAATDPGFLKTAQTVSQIIADSYRQGGKVLIAGNGGSAADAQHIAAEFVSRYRFDRPPLPAIALTTDTSVLTAIGNDYGYEQVFERQIRGLGRKGDVFIAISTSGRSPNILAALKAAREIGVVTVGFTGAGDSAKAMRVSSDFLLIVPVADTPLIQQIHMTVAHAIIETVEKDYFPCQKNRSAQGAK